MWLLISEKGELFHITPQKEHIVGRKDGAIILSNDQSISRHHATIILKSDDPNEDGNIILVDTSSKYGTYVNDGIDTSERVKEKEEVILKHDDLIRFGLQWNKWRVIFMPVIVLSSTVKQHEKALVKSQIQKLGGKFLSSWSPSCTHLVMNQITLTVKVVSALGAGQHIVMPTYWQKLLDAVESKNGNLPNPADYLPPLNETTLNENQVSFSVNKQRSSLFKSLLFVASSSKQLSRIEPMVTAAGGKVVELSNCSLTKEDLCKDGVILMQSSADSSSQTQNSQVSPNSLILAKYLLSKGLRCIPESDIGLSVVYCSREKFCNPKYRLVSLFETHPAPMQQTEPSMIIAPETEVHSFARPLGTEWVIDETCVNTTTTLSGKSVKRPLNEESDEEENSRTFKKPLTQNTNKKKVPNVLEVLKKNSKNDAGSPHSENNNLTCNKKPNKSNEGIFIEDSDEENSDSNVPRRKDQSKSPEPSNESENDIFGSSNKNNRTATNNNIPTSVDMFSMEKTVTKTNIPTSVDMFSLRKNSSSPVEQKKQSDNSNYKPLTSSTPLTKTLKKSYDMFDISNISSSSNTKKSSQCNDNFINEQNSNFLKVGDSDDDDDDFGSKSSKQDSIALVNDNGDDFEFKSNSRRNSNLSIRNDDDDEDNNDFGFQSTIKQNKNLKQNLNKSSAKDHIFQVSSSTNELKRLTTEDISDGNEMKNTKRIKLSEDVFQSSSKSTGLKRRTSGDCEDNFNNEGSSSKKLPVIIEDSEDYINERFGNDFIKKEIKEEPDDELLNGDYNDHGMTVVEVKSLLAPLREISLSKDPNEQQTFNFKKFRKATPLKVPEFIDLVEYMGNVTGTWADELDSAHSDTSDEDADGWKFQENKVAKQKKATNRRVKL